MQRNSALAEDLVTQPGKMVGWRFVFVFTVAILVVYQSAAQPTDTGQEGIVPPDVYVRTLVVRDELELIRLEMGKPQDTRQALRVTDAEPREVFSQALTLFHKVNQLSFDLTRERVDLPEKPVGTLRPTHVKAVVDAVLGRLQRIKATFGNPEQSREQPRDPTATPSDSSAHVRRTGVNCIDR